MNLSKRFLIIHIGVSFDDLIFRIWSVSCNRFHDQLLISGSSDTQVNLQNVVSVSSSQFKKGEQAILDELKASSEASVEEEDLVNKTIDGLVATYDQHEDSVYSACWSMADPWIFASLSFDGIVSINCVPSAHKYKIIL